MRTGVGILLAGALALSAPAEPFRAGDRVCFFGDSITHGGVWHRNVILYYVTRFPDRDVAFMNSGSGGDNAANALKVRLEPDVVARKPTDVVVMFGMNDFGFREYGTNATPAQVARQAQRLSEYARNMDLLVAGLRRRLPGVRLCLMTPTPFDDAALYGKPVNEHLGANGGLTCAADIVARLAGRADATLVDLNAAVKDYYRRVRASDDRAVFAADRIHPDAATHFMMAHRFLEAQNAPRVVSDIMLQDVRAVGVRNAAVSDISWSDGSVSFKVLEKSLPWPVGPEEGRGGELVRAAAADFNGETLAFAGLADGDWTLTIDGDRICTASARQWAIGVDLGGNAQTPQYRQALDVWRETKRLHERMGQVQADNVLFIRSAAAQMRQQGLDPSSPEDRARYLTEWLPRAQPWDVAKMRNAMQEWDANDRLIRDVDVFWPRLRALATPRPHRYALTREASKAGGGLDLAWADGDLRLVDAARGETLFRIPEGRLMTPSFAADARATVVQEPDGVRIVYSHPSLVSGEVRLKKVATGLSLAAAFAPKDDVVLNRLNVFPKGTTTACYEIKNFKNIHATSAVRPQVLLGGETFAINTYSKDWQFAPHPTAMLFTRNPAQVLVGATCAPVGGYGLYAEGAKSEIDAFYLDYGPDAWGWRIRAGETWTSPESRIVLDHSNDPFRAWANFGDVLVREGLVPDPAKRPFVPWHHDNVYCTWHDQTLLSGYIPDGVRLDWRGLLPHDGGRLDGDVHLSVREHALLGVSERVPSEVRRVVRRAGAAAVRGGEGRSVGLRALHRQRARVVGADVAGRLRHGAVRRGDEAAGGALGPRRAAGVHGRTRAGRRHGDGGGQTRLSAARGRNLLPRIDDRDPSARSEPPCAGRAVRGDGWGASGRLGDGGAILRRGHVQLLSVGRPRARHRVDGASAAGRADRRGVCASPRTREEAADRDGVELPRA